MTQSRKPIGIRALAPVAAATLMALTLAGCGGSAEEDGVVESPAVTEESPVVEQTDPAVEEDPAQEPDTQEEADPGTEAAPQGDGIEAYVAAEQETMDGMMDSLGGSYESVEINAVGDSGIEYVYTFAEALDPETAGPSLEGTADTLEETTQSLVFPAMDRFGVPAPREATFIYANPDGTVLWELNVTE